MRVDILTVLPDLLESPLNTSILKRAQDKGLVEINLHNLRDYSTNKQKSVDDTPFGGGAGMVMQIQPIADCIEKLKNERTYDEIIYMTPDGETMKQGMVNTLSLKENIIILAGHYKGIDERIRELPAAILSDAIIRLIPGVINDETSALTDSFQDGLLAPPVYTRPEIYKGLAVPKILTEGNHKAIDVWREEKAIERTQERRPDLLD